MVREKRDLRSGRDSAKRLPFELIYPWLISNSENMKNKPTTFIIVVPEGENLQIKADRIDPIKNLQRQFFSGPVPPTAS